MSDEVNPFELLPVIIAGTQLYVRPVTFAYDDAGSITKALVYNSTCPKCSQLIEIDINKVVHVDGKSYYSACVECPLPPTLASATLGFSDPIKTGVMVVEGFTKADV